jgi:Cd2+/Zn2+-exporting ATPase/Cu+-exporting ATPase
MTDLQRLEVPVRGMDCAECTQHVQKAIAGVRGVQSVEVMLASEKAIVHLDPRATSLPAIRTAVESAGYRVPDEAIVAERPSRLARMSRPLIPWLTIGLGGLLLLLVLAEALDLIDPISESIPAWIPIAFVTVVGFPIFRNVARQALHGRVIAHTLMSLGVLAALFVGQWLAAALIVFLMWVGDAIERYTAGTARRAVRSLTELMPQSARLESDGVETEVPIAQVRVGDLVVVRPGERVPVDGLVIDGHATLDVSPLTGEAMPVEVAVGSKVMAASLAQLGSLRVRAAHIGPDTTFGQVIRMVEEAEANRGTVQRMADRFSGYYLPVVLGVALLSLVLRRDPSAVAAVLLVACSCSFALATPIAVMATIGAAARRGVLFKGGRVIEALDKASVLLIDKTGTLTLGRPQLTDVLPLDGRSADELLGLAASAERYSEHPLATAVRAAAQARGIALEPAEAFEALPGLGLRARIDGKRVTVGSNRLVRRAAGHGESSRLEAQGKTLLHVEQEGELIGTLAFSDTVRAEVPAALEALRRLGLNDLHLLTGDNRRTAAALAGILGLPFSAELLPQDKIEIVRRLQGEGKIVVMIGDGVNDAPALAQADVGIAMGAIGSDVALEAAAVALMGDDWAMVPEALLMARRTMSVVRMNLGFTVVYNAIGLTLAALGILPPVLAAAAQSIPDLGILANSSRLLRQGGAAHVEAK